MVLELDLVVPLRLNLSVSYLNLKKRQIRSIFVMCVKLPLKNPYNLKMNWEQLKTLQMGVDKSNVEELGDIEAHTYYMYKNGYTESKLPGSMLDPGIHTSGSLKVENTYLVPYIVPEVC